MYLEGACYPRNKIVSQLLFMSRLKLIFFWGSEYFSSFLKTFGWACCSAGAQDWMEAPEILWETLFCDRGPASHPKWVCKTQLDTQACEYFLCFWSSLIWEIDPIRLPVLWCWNNSHCFTPTSQRNTFNKLETQGKKYSGSDPVKNWNDLKLWGKKTPDLLSTCCPKQSSKLSDRHPYCCAEEQDRQVGAKRIHLQCVHFQRDPCLPRWMQSKGSCCISAQPVFCFLTLAEGECWDQYWCFHFTSEAEWTLNQNHPLPW